MPVLYFAYGSNMDVEQMRTRGAEFTARRRAILRDYVLKFNKISTAKKARKGEGKANVAPDAHGIVEGALYTISEEGLKQLDEKEVGYYRTKVHMELSDETLEESWIYVAQAEKVRGGLKPTKKYLDHCLAGRDLLSDEYYRTLEETE